MEKLTLIQKMQIANKKIGAIEKNLTVGTGNSAYKAVADLDVILRVKEIEQDCGIISIAIKQEVISSEVIKYIDAYGKDKMRFVDNIKMVTRFYNIDDSKDFIDIETNAKGIDAGDKGLGKASTYARKYALLNAYKIPTGEDVDAKLSDELQPVTVDERKDKVVNYLLQNDKRKEAVLGHFNLGSVDDFDKEQIKSLYDKFSKEGVL